MIVIDNPTHSPNTQGAAEQLTVAKLLDIIYDLYTAQCWDPLTETYNHRGRPFYIEVEDLLIRTGYLSEVDNDNYKH